MQPPAPKTYRERLTTPDGDFIDLDWSYQHTKTKSIAASTTDMQAVAESNHNNEQDQHGVSETNTSIVVIFHGLAGSSKSSYVMALTDSLNQLGYRSVTMNFRGCSGEPNLKIESYHSGHTKDISFVIDTIAQRYPDARLSATGYSLGGNALLKYLATSPHNPLNHALSISPPLLLAEGAKRMEAGFSRIYQNRLVGLLKAALDEKHRRYPLLGINKIDYRNTTTFREFDTAVTAPTHGFSSVDEYYDTASTLQDLPTIRTPTHVLFARDDPFFTENCIPVNGGMSAQVTFELATHGGHVAFVNGNVPACGKSWLTRRLSELHSKLLHNRSTRD